MLCIILIHKSESCTCTCSIYLFSNSIKSYSGVAKQRMAGDGPTDHSDRPTHPTDRPTEHTNRPTHPTDRHRPTTHRTGLPASSNTIHFTLKKWKKIYANSDMDVALAWFFENFDDRHFSVWYSEYKYPEELGKTFMSCNLISGLYQRLEFLRSDMFANMCVFGSDFNSSISGIWVWAGLDLIFERSPDYQLDYDLYTWKKLTLDNQKNVKMITEYLTQKGQFDGKQFNQAKKFL